MSGGPALRVHAGTETETVITDIDGRKLSLRRLTALDKLRLFKAMGPQLAQNGPYLGIAVLACSVAAIDDVPVPMPVSEPLIEALVQRLGDAGLVAIGRALVPEQTPASVVDSAKN